MDVGEKSVKVDFGMELKGVEGEEIVEVAVGSERELEVTRNKCKELEGRSKKAEDNCMALELEIEKRKGEFELLQGKFSALEVKKSGVEDEIKVLKGMNAELERQITLFENENEAVGGVKGTQIVVDLTEEKDEEDKVIQLMIENKVLECEKKKVESELEVWKLKCGQLESQVRELEKENLILRGGQSPLAGMMKTQLEMHKKQTTDVSNLNGGLNAVASSEHMETKSKLVDKNETIHSAIGMSSNSSPPLEGIEDLQLQGTACTPLTDRPSMQSTHIEGRKRCFIFEPESRVRKQLAFGEEGILCTKMAPSTPGGAKQPPFGLVDISDSEDELANTNVNMPHFKSQVNGSICVSTNFSSGGTVGNESNKTSDDNLKRTLFDPSDEEDMSSYNGTFPVVSTPKRKRASNIVTTDSESDDDNIPICKLRTKHLRELNHDAVAVIATVSKEKVHESAATPRRRLVTLRQCNVKNVPDRNSPCNSNDGGSNYYSRIRTNEGVEDDVPESDTEGESLGGFIVKSSDVSDSDDDSSASEDVSDENVDFSEVLSTIRRQGNSKLKWDFEADMLAAFGKDLALCMKAVCALYRQQTSEEKFSKGTLYSNQRGFSQCDAFRGTNLAEFLTDGDAKGDLNKSVEELQEYDPKGPELCRTLATHYSKQLFAIYKNKEDPLFLPS